MPGADLHQHQQQPVLFCPVHHPFLDRGKVWRFHPRIRKARVDRDMDQLLAALGAFP